MSAWKSACKRRRRSRTCELASKLDCYREGGAADAETPNGESELEPTPLPEDIACESEVSSEAENRFR